MKKVFFIFLVVIGAWQTYQEFVPRLLYNEDIEFDYKPSEESFRYSFDDDKFKCDGRQYCSQMSSMNEAIFFINNCPNTKMDGDHDGNPCENDTRLNGL